MKLNIFPKKLSFYKKDGCWYINWMNRLIAEPHRQMVAGTDILLDYAANGNDTVTIETFSKNPKIILKRTRLSKYGGAWYSVSFPSGDIEIPADEVWICNVTLFVFMGHFPKRFDIGW